MDPMRFMFPVVVPALVVVCTMGTVLLIFFRHSRMVEKKRDKATEVLKVYAERGEAPPESVIDALMGSATAWKPQPPKPETRARHFSDFASCSVFALGATGLASWQALQPGNHSGAFVILVTVALIFTAGAVSHLVRALHIRDGQ